MSEIKTNKDLLDVLKNAVHHKPSPEEILEQRVSFVFSLLNPEIAVTREEVRRGIIDQLGGVTEPDK